MCVFYSLRNLFFELSNFDCLRKLKELLIVEHKLKELLKNFL